MLDMAQLRSALGEAIDQFVKTVMTLCPDQPQQPRVVSVLGEEVLRVVSDNPNGITANDLAEEVGVGFAPMFEELHDLRMGNHLIRIVRGEAELPIYVLPKSPKQG